MPASSRKKPEESKTNEQTSEAPAAALDSISADATVKTEENITKSEPTPEQPVPAEPTAVSTETAEKPDVPKDDPSPKGKEKAEPWPEHFDTSLKPFLSEDVIARVKNLFLEGPEPPLVSDSGWAGRAAKVAAQDNGDDAAPEPPAEEPAQGRGKKGRDRGGRGGRGARGGRGGGRGGRPGMREDHRKVLSDVCTFLFTVLKTEYVLICLVFTNLCEFSPSHRKRHGQDYIKLFVSFSMVNLIQRQTPLLLRAMMAHEL